MSVKSKVFGALLGSSFLMFLGVSFFGYFFVRNLVTNHIHAKLSARAEQYAKLTDRVMSERCREVLLFSKQDFFFAEWIDDAQKQSNLRRLMKDSGFYRSGIYVNVSAKVKDIETQASLEGRVMVASDPDMAGADMKGEPWYAACLETRGLAISRARHEKDSRIPVITLAAPVLDMEGEMWGVLAMNLDLRIMPGRMTQEEQKYLELSGIKGGTFIINSEGNIVSADDPSLFLTPFDKIVPEEYAEKLAAGGESGILDISDPDGKTEMLAGYAIHKGYGLFDRKWTSVMTAETALLDRTVLTTLSGILGVFALIVCSVVMLAALLAHFVSRSISLPVHSVIAGLERSAEQVSAASGEISSASRSVARSASEQANAVEETSSSLGEISHVSRETLDITLKVEGLMNENIEKSAQSLSALVRLTRQMSQIEGESDQIRQLIKTIDNIAFQTNLLSLNAAVEAARAGSSGAGFAVVADEVRNLSLKTADTARDTEALLNNIIERVAHSAHAIREINEDFEGIIESATTMGEKAANISSSGQSQVSEIDRIGRSMAEMDRGARRNAAHAEQSASAAREMNAQAEEIKGFVEKLAALILSGKHAKNKRRSQPCTKTNPYVS